MSVIIVENPIRNHSENVTNQSKWSASRHPYLFKFWRIDVVIQAYVDNGGLLRIIAATTQTAASELIVGSSIAVNDLGTYNVSGKVTAVINTGTPNYMFDTDIPYAGAPPAGGYLNILSRLNYFIEVTIKGTDPISGVQKNWAVLRIDTDNKGYARLDVAGCLNGYVDKKNDYDYSTKNVIDPYVWGEFSLSYQSKWLNGEDPTIFNDPNVYFFIDGTKTLLAKYGQNFCDYLPFNNDSLTEKAKFLSDFTRPTYFVGYPFDLSVIIPKVFGTSIGLTGNEERFLLNGASDGTQSEALILYAKESVQRVKIMQGYGSTIEQIDFWLQGNSIPESSYYEDGYIADDYFESVGGSLLDPFRITEKKRIKIVRPCEKNVVYLCWRNTKGGWSYWLFNKFQEASVNTSIAGYFGQEPDNLETGITRELTTVASVQEKITVGAQVDLEDLSGLKFLEGSPRILMLYSLSPIRWLTVRVSPKGVKYRTDAQNTVVEFDLLLPEHYTIPN